MYTKFLGNSCYFTQIHKHGSHGGREKVRASPKLVAFIVCETWISVQNFVPTCLVDVEIRICEHFDLLVALDRKLGDHQKDHPLETMDMDIWISVPQFVAIYPTPDMKLN